MIQGGSPSGQGTDGPGYSFDEFSASVRHNGFGVLSKANSGPDSNGAQFFITVAATSWLDDVHAIFGRLTGGSNVVHAISRVATDANNKPLTNVVTQSVNIRRVASAAQMFDLRALGLAVATNLTSALGRTVTLNFTGGSPVIVVSFDNSGGGTYTSDQGPPGDVESHTWVQEPYRGRLYPIYFPGIIPMVLHLDYGTFTSTP